MSSEQLALVIVAGIWAALNTLVSVFRVVNDKGNVGSRGATVGNLGVLSGR